MATSIVIITDEVYLNAKSINSVTSYENEVEESLARRLRRAIKEDSVKRPKSRRKRRSQKAKEVIVPKPPTVTIDINYTDLQDQVQSCCMTYSKVKAGKMFKTIVKQIREQHPDKAMMDHLIDKYLFDGSRQKNNRFEK